MSISVTAISLLLAVAQPTIPDISGDWGGRQQSGPYARVEQSGSKIKIIIIKGTLIDERYVPGDVAFDGRIVASTSSEDWRIEGKALYRISDYERREAPGAQNFQYETTGFFHSHRRISDGMLDQYLFFRKKWFKFSTGGRVFDQESGEFFISRFKKPGSTPPRPKANISKPPSEPLGPYPPLAPRVLGVVVIDDGFVVPWANPADVAQVMGRRKADRRTLLVFGPYLPQDSVNLTSQNPSIFYSLLDTSDDRRRGSNDPFETYWRLGWSKALTIVPPFDEVIWGPMKGLLVEARLNGPVMSRTQGFTLGRLAAEWLLPTSNIPGTLRFKREIARDSYEEANTLYHGDRFLVELQTDPAYTVGRIPLALQRQGRVLRPSDGPHHYLQRVEGTGGLYRSVVFEATTRMFESGDTFTATVRSTSGFSNTIVSEVKVFTDPASHSMDWKLAIEHAARLNGVPIPADPIDASRTVADELAAYSLWDVYVKLDPQMTMMPLVRLMNFGLREPPNDSNIRRLTRVTMGDHAAMILLRRVFIEELSAYIDEVERLRHPDVAESVRQMLLANPNHSLGNSYVGVIGNTTYNFNLKRAVSDQYLAGHGNKEQWIRTVVPHALHNHLVPVRRSLERARATEENDIPAMLLLTGSGFQLIESRLKPRLVRKTAQGSWEPDPIARVHVQQVAYVGQEYKANRKVADADTQVILGIAALIPFALPAASTLRLTASLIIGGIDLADYAMHQVPQAIRSWREVEFARGAAAVLDAGRLTSADLEKQSLCGTILCGLAALLGSTCDFAEALAKARIVAAEGRVKSILAEASQADSALNFHKARSVQERVDLSTIGRAAANKAATDGLQSLSEFERQAVNYYRKLATEIELTPSGALYFSELASRPPWAQLPEIVKPPAAAKRTPLRKRPPAGLPPSLAKRVGECISDGTATCTVFLLSEESGLMGLVLKIVKDSSDEFDPSTAAQIIDRLQAGERLLKAAGIAVEEMSGVVRTGVPRFQQRLVQPGPKVRFYPASSSEMLPEGIQKAVLRLYRKLADNGTIWADPHLGNMYFRKIGEPDNWEAVVWDPDFVVRWNQNPGNEGFAIRLNFFEGMPGQSRIHSLMGASDLNHALASPPPVAPRRYRDARQFMQKMMERAGLITFDLTQLSNRPTIEQIRAAWKSKRLDLKLVEDFFPGFKDDVIPSKELLEPPMILDLRQFFNLIPAAA